LSNNIPEVRTYKSVASVMSFDFWRSPFNPSPATNVAHAQTVFYNLKT